MLPPCKQHALLKNYDDVGHEGPLDHLQVTFRVVQLIKELVNNKELRTKQSAKLPQILCTYPEYTTMT